MWFMQGNRYVRFCVIKTCIILGDWFKLQCHIVWTRFLVISLQFRYNFVGFVIRGSLYDLCPFALGCLTLKAVSYISAKSFFEASPAYISWIHTTVNPPPDHSITFLSFMHDFTPIGLLSQRIPPATSKYVNSRTTAYTLIKR